MSGRILAGLAVAALGLTAASCEPLPRPQKQAATLVAQTMPYTDAIPAEFGDLIAVTTDSRLPHSVQLWFQKADKSIVLVFADHRNHFISPQTITIPRR
jgi:hypothetical protein